jgi:ABC-type antimicrobial peptide transport system permease subunit
MPINLSMAFKALMQHRLQAMLTFVGMSVGVAMVVIVSGLGLGAQAKIESQIETSGPTMISVRSGNLHPAAIAARGQDTSGGEQAEGNSAAMGGDGSSDIGVEDNSAISNARKRAAALPQNKYHTPATPLGQPELELFKTGIPNVRTVAGSAEGNFTLGENAGIATRIVHLNGIDVAWPDMKGWKLHAGRWMSSEEVAGAAAVMLVPASVAEKYWPGTSPLNKTVVMKGQPVQVVGVISGNGVDGNGSPISNVYVPLPLAQHLLGHDTFDTITVRTTSVGVTTAVTKAITDGLRKLHKLDDQTMDDFRVESQSVSAMPSMGMDPRLARSVHANMASLEKTSWEEMARSLRAAGRTFSLLLSAAAAVSLLVGGIGVMNIMLVSVAARTREIGLRMALGARMGDVMTQFIVEAVVLAAIGGLIGCALGAAALWLASRGFAWSAIISPTMLLLAVGMAVLTGLIFGYGPARRAAGLDPVIALKSE